MIPKNLKYYVENAKLNKLETFSLEIYKTLLSIHRPSTPEQCADLQVLSIEQSINLLYRLSEAQNPTNTDLTNLN